MLVFTSLPEERKQHSMLVQLKNQIIKSEMACKHDDVTLLSDRKLNL